MDYPTLTPVSISSALEALDGYRLETDGKHWTLKTKDNEALWTTGGMDQEESFKMMIVVALNQTAKKLDSYRDK